MVQHMYGHLRGAYNTAAAVVTAGAGSLQLQSRHDAIRAQSAAGTCCTAPAVIWSAQERVRLASGTAIRRAAAAAGFGFGFFGRIGLRAALGGGPAGWSSPTTGLGSIDVDAGASKSPGMLITWTGTVSGWNWFSV